MDVRIAGYTVGSIVDGKGIRFTIYMQGCKHNCIGCHNPSTHDMAGGELTTTEEVINKIKAQKMFSGITLSGGDPFFQPEAAKKLADATHYLGKNVWCYTGYTFEQIRDSNNKAMLELLKSIDVLVDGRFVLELKTLDLPFRGSSNQRIIDVKKTIETGEVSLLDA